MLFLPLELQWASKAKDYSTHEDKWEAYKEFYEAELKRLFDYTPKIQKAYHLDEVNELFNNKIGSVIEELESAYYTSAQLEHGAPSTINVPEGISTTGTTSGMTDTKQSALEARVNEQATLFLL